MKYCYRTLHFYNELFFLAEILCFSTLLCFHFLFFITTAQADSSESKPEYGGNMIMGIIGEPSNLIPFLASDSSSSQVASLLYIAPLEYDKNMNLIKCAAEKWEVSEDGLTMRFKLREDICWEDGFPLTADDVSYTYNIVINPSTPTAYAADFLAIKKFTQLDKFSFEVQYDKPYARASVTWLHPILPKHILEKENLASTKYSRKPIGSGPYKLISWIPGSKLVLQANNRYFRGRPYIDTVVFRIIPDSTTMFLEARSGKIDYIGLTPQQFCRQTQTEYFETYWKKYKYLASAYTYLGFNFKSPLFSDKKVRQAVTCAIDKKSIIKGVLHGLGESIEGPYKPGNWACNTSLLPYPYDPEYSLKLLKEAGWEKDQKGVLRKNGQPFKFSLLVNQGNDDRIKIAVIIQQMLKKIGMQVSVRTVEWAAFIREFVMKKKFDALILGWTITEDPDAYDVWHSNAISANGLNFISYSNPEVDMILEKARLMVNRNSRKKLYDRFQEILYEDQPYVFLYCPYSLPMIRSSFKGIEPGEAGIMYNFDKWWLPKNFQQ